MSAAARFRYAIVAGATAVVIGIGFTAAGFARRGAESPSPRSADAPLAAVAPSDQSGDLLDDATAGADASPSTPPTSPSASATSPAPARTSSRPRPRRTTPPAAP